VHLARAGAGCVAWGEEGGVALARVGAMLGVERELVDC
jgi:hypothetical protein